MYVGRLSAEKSIQQFRPVLRAIPGLRVAIVGDGPQRRNLEQYFAGTPTYFSGYLHGQELAAAYSSADVFFMPSRTETLGFVVLEAMAAGCPVVAVADGGIVDIVQDGVTGHLYAPDDLNSAAEAIRRLLFDSTHREKIRIQARREVEKWGRLAATQQLERFYRDVLHQDEELPGRIVAQMDSGAPVEQICQSLQISRATFNRHISNGRAPGNWRCGERRKSTSSTE